MLVNDFTTVFGEIKEVKLDESDIYHTAEDIENMREERKMELDTKPRFDKDEKIKRWEEFDGNYGKQRFVLYCESGNVYSAFLKPEVIEQITDRYSEGDVAMITYTENPDKSDPDKVYKNLEGMSEKKQSVTETEESTPDAEPEQAVLAAESPPEGTLNEKQPSGKGEGRVAAQMGLEKPPSTDTKISRMNSMGTSFEFYGDLCRAGIVKNEDEAVERAFKLGRTLEEDINRKGE